MNPATILRSIVLACLAAWSLPAPAQSTSDAIALRMDRLAHGDTVVRGEQLIAPDLMQEFYSHKRHQRVWTDSDRLDEAMSILRNSDAHGLVPSDYHLATLEALINQGTDRSGLDEADLDMLLTDALVMYGYHLRFGKVNPATVDKDINFARTFRFDQPVEITMEQAFTADSLTSWFDAAFDDGPVYKMLQAELSAYRKIAATGGWPTVPEGPTLHPGDSDSRVPALRQRLVASGELTSGTSAGNTFDDGLEAAVKDFQRRHHLDDDGVVGAQTLAQMNATVEDRIDQLRLSLERIRWLQSEIEGDFVFVNIASFRAWLVRDGEIAWTQPVMVGKNYRQTPVFAEDLRYLELNPTWTVPPGILRNDILPKIRKDPNYLSEQNMDVLTFDGERVDPATVDFNKWPFPYMIRQRPGPLNALGTIKFIFPNPHYVFLHDTSHRELFDRNQRAFSSGCVRVYDPLSLGEALMNDPDNYSRSDLQAILDGRKTQRIYPEDDIRVIIAYMTGWVDLETGQAIFAPDVYDRDARVLAALDGPVTFELPDGS